MKKRKKKKILSRESLGNKSREEFIHEVEILGFSWLTPVDPVQMFHTGAFEEELQPINLKPFIIIIYYVPSQREDYCR